MSFDRAQFEKDRLTNAEKMTRDKPLERRAFDFITESDKYYHAYQWNWLGMPIIQMTEDIIVTQELIWKVQPDVIIETGIAWGGSMIFYASILELIGKGKVVGVDVALPQKNIDAIMKYPFSQRITLINGSSVDKAIVNRIKSHVKAGQSVMLCLDSNHTHEHVLQELQLYSPLVTKDSYIIVSDTVVEDIPPQEHRPRPWGPGNNPKTAVNAFLETADRFEPDPYYNSKILLTFNKGGYIRCIR